MVHVARTGRAFGPLKADPPLVVDPDTVLALPMAFHCFQSVDLCLQHRSHVPCLNTNHRQVCFTERTKQPLRQRSSFQSNPLEAAGSLRQNRQ